MNTLQWLAVALGIIGAALVLLLLWCCCGMAARSDEQQERIMAELRTQGRTHCGHDPSEIVCELEPGAEVGTCYCRACEREGGDG